MMMARLVEGRTAQISLEILISDEDVRCGVVCACSTWILNAVGAMGCDAVSAVVWWSLLVVSLHVSGRVRFRPGIQHTVLHGLLANRKTRIHTSFTPTAIRNTTKYSFAPLRIAEDEETYDYTLEYAFTAFS